jgi:hypothetical protein
MVIALPHMPDGAVEIDLVATWPAPLLAWARRAVENRADALRDGYISGFADEDARVWDHIGGRGVCVYHCARLLTHEINDIRHNGLLPLSQTLVDERIRSAEQHGYLSKGEADECRARWSALRASQGDYRQGLLWAVAGRRVLERHGDGLSGFLRSWGGEAIFGGPIDNSAALAIGTPTVVAATVRPGDYSKPPGGAMAWAFAAALSEEVSPEWQGAEFSIRGAVREITDVWTPGHPEYDRLAAFPRD